MKKPKRPDELEANEPKPVTSVRVYTYGIVPKKKKRKRIIKTTILKP